MTVRELIEHLKMLPQDSLVVYKNCSDLSKLEADNIEVVSASDKKVVQHHNMPDQVRDYREYEYKRPATWPEKSRVQFEGVEPKFLDAVIFPGN